MSQICTNTRLDLDFFAWNIFRVKLAVNRETQQAIAVKIIDLEKAADCYDNVRKEVSSEMIV